MKIVFDNDNNFYQEDEKKLQNSITVFNDNKEYHYAFERNKDTALVRYDDISYIDEASEFFRKHNMYINKIKSIDNKYYREFDYTYSFKLPLNILQPKDVYIDEDRYNYLNEIDLDPEHIYLPVRLIDDEYVLLDGVTRLKIMKENYDRLVNVYIDNNININHDFLYILKEKNILNIDDVSIIPHDKYLNYLEVIKNFKE